MPVKVNLNEPSVQYKISTLVKNYVLNGEKINFSIRNPSDSTGTVFFNIHDDENTAVLATDSFLQQYPVKFIELQYKGKRHVSGMGSTGRYFHFDPNRIFSDFGVFQTLRVYRTFTTDNKKAVNKFAAFICDSLLNDAKKIVAVHNNSKGFSIKKYMPDSVYAKNAAEIHINENRNPTEFFYVIDSSHFEYFKNLNFNVILQGPQVEEDGSLSVYCAQKGIFYINVEAKEENLSEQYEMLIHLKDLLRR